MAVPLILTGLRVSAVQVVATATLGALVGYRNLGTPIVSGFTSPDKGPLLAGAMPSPCWPWSPTPVRPGRPALVPWRRAGAGQADVTVTAEEAAPRPR